MFDEFVGSAETIALVPKLNMWFYSSHFILLSEPIPKWSDELQVHLFGQLQNIIGLWKPNTNVIAFHTFS